MGQETREIQNAPFDKINKMRFDSLILAQSSGRERKIGKGLHRTDVPERFGKEIASNLCLPATIRRIRGILGKISSNQSKWNWTTESLKVFPLKGSCRRPDRRMMD